MTIRFFIIIDIVNCYYLVFKISFGKALQKWGVLFFYIVKMLYIWLVILFYINRIIFFINSLTIKKWGFFCINIWQLEKKVIY